MLLLDFQREYARPDNAASETVAVERSAHYSSKKPSKSVQSSARHFGILLVFGERLISSSTAEPKLAVTNTLDSRRQKE